MTISITDIQSEQNDINIFINGRNREISDDETEKIRSLFQKNGDICITLEDCDMSYMETIQKTIRAVRPKSIVIIGVNGQNDVQQLVNFKKRYPRAIISINDEKELKWLEEIPEMLTNVIVPYNLIPLIYNNSKNIIINTSNITEIKTEDINMMEHNKRIRGVVFSWENIKGFHCRNFVNFREFREITERLTKMSDIAQRNGNNELARFLSAYHLIGQNIEYDFNEDGESSRKAISHSLKGALLYGKAVCEGYAESLCQLLNILGIENKCVTGKSGTSRDNSRHVWNQVKIDGSWYNCDITNDSVNIQQERGLEYCLLSDREFFLYSSTSRNAERCFIIHTKSYYDRISELE